MSEFEAWLCIFWCLFIFAMWVWMDKWPSKFMRWWKMQKCEVCRKRTKDLFKFASQVIYECLPCAIEREQRKYMDRMKEADNE